MPKVTVFIPVYNRAAYVGTAIESVLAQTFGDFELLLVDDGSSDDSVAAMRRYRDPRLRIEQNERHLGVPRTRNRGLDLARGQYIALLDSDDRCVPERLAKQVAFLDHHPEYAEIGSWNRSMDSAGRALRKVKRQPIGAEETRATLLFRCALKNRSIMGRTELLRRFRYREQFERCQDYDLHVRLARHYKLGNLPEILVYGRLHHERWTAQTQELGKRAKLAIMAEQLGELGIVAEPCDLERHFSIAHRDSGATGECDRAYLLWVGDWLERLRRANQQRRLYSEPVFDRVVGEFWLSVCVRAIGAIGAAGALAYLRSGLPKGIAPFVEREFHRWGLHGAAAAIAA